MKKRLIIIVCIVILFIENLPEGIITSAIEKSIVGKNEKICSNYNNKIINNYDANAWDIYPMHLKILKEKAQK